MVQRPGWKWWLVGAATALALAGCAGPGEQAVHLGDSVITAALATPPGAEAGSAWRSDISRQMERFETTARTPAEWADLWRRSGHAAPGSLPGEHMAAAIFLGTRVSGGYTITIDPAEVRKGDDGVLLIGYREQVPGPEALVAPGQTSPFTVMILPLEPRQVRFVRLS
ncbi:Protease complex subunit PrcB family protein [uncultured Gammaproteobacteria bacterium]